MYPTALFLLVLFPFVGAIFASLMKVPQVARVWAILVGFCTFVLALLVAIGTSDGPVHWGYDLNNVLSIPDIGFATRLSCDGISAWLLLITTGLFPLIFLSLNSQLNEDRGARGYYAWMLVLLGSLVGVFVAGDALLFYFFFELTLVPTLLLIALWGGPDRRAAAGKFFIYTFAGSIFTLIALIYLGSKAGTFEIGAMTAAAQNTVLVSTAARFWVGLALLVGFLVKTPVFPLHTWQPVTYSESPNAVTVVLAAIMSKLGTYGLLRLTLPMGFVGATIGSGHIDTLHWVITLALISIVYGGLIAWVQKDMARLMAYSSLSHLGLCVLAIFAFSTLSLQGAVAYMLAHTLATAAIFLIIGMITIRTGTRDMTQISGLFKSMPVLCTLLVLFVMASIGLPITSGFIGEFLSLQGVMNGMGLATTAIAAIGMILGAIYMLNMVAKIGFGPQTAPEGAALSDATFRDLVVLLPIAAAVLLLGIMPTPVLDSFKSDVASINTVVQGSIGSAHVFPERVALGTLEK